MAEEKEIVLKNKDVARFNRSIRHLHCRLIGSRFERRNCSIGDGYNAEAMLADTMTSQQRHNLNANEGHVIKITKWIEIEHPKKYSMVIQEYELMDLRFQAKENYKYIIAKQKKFKKASKFINFEHDIDNIQDNQ